MSVNLSSTTPAAPSGKTLVQFQTDGSGNVSGYIAAATELVGDSIDLTGQTANISTTPLIASPSGLYRVSAYVIVTTVDGASSTLPSVVIAWDDKDNGQPQTFTLTPTSTGNLLTTCEQDDMIVSAGSTANLSFSTTGYASGTPAAMHYAVHIRIEEF
jgi:hypothetical protein